VFSISLSSSSPVRSFWEGLCRDSNPATTGLREIERIEAPTIADSRRSRFVILWDVRKPLTIWRYADGREAIKGNGLDIEGDIAITRDAGGIHIRLAAFLPSSRPKRPVKPESQFVTLLPDARYPEDVGKQETSCVRAGRLNSRKDHRRSFPQHGHSPAGVALSADAGRLVRIRLSRHMLPR